MKRYNKNIESYDKVKEYTVNDAVDLLYAFEKWKKYQDQQDFHVK